MKDEMMNLVENIMIDHFTKAAFLKVKKQVKREGQMNPTLIILTKKNDHFKVVREKVPKMDSFKDSDKEKDIAKSISIGLAINLYFEHLKEEGYELFYMVHSEILEVDDGDNDMLFFLEKDLRVKTDVTKPTFYDIKRGESRIDETGKVVFGDIEFVERNEP